MKRKRFFTADWHCFHDNCLIFDKRPFNSIDEMHKVLIKRFNTTVPKHGITYFLGDMGFRTNSQLKEIIDQLNGTKILVSGNHDGGMDAMYAAGFDVVIHKAQLVIGKSILTMSHCPLYGVFREDTTGMNGCSGDENWHREEKHKHKYSMPDFGQFHFHGHIHAAEHNKKPVKEGRQWDVGVVGNNYTPITLSQAVSWMDLYNKELNEKK